MGEWSCITPFIVCNVPQFSDRQVWANCIDEDQTTEEQDILNRVFTVLHSYIFWMH